MRSDVLQFRLKVYKALCASTAITLTLCVIAGSTQYWIKTTADNENAVHTGLFVESTGPYEFNCNMDMSVTECGYLKSSKATFIISCLLGLFAAVIFYSGFSRGWLSAAHFAGACACNLGQALFGIMSLVLYLYLKRSYFSHDTYNVEYPNNENSTFDWGFYLVVASTTMAFVISAAAHLIRVSESSFVSKRDEDDFEAVVSRLTGEQLGTGDDDTMKAEAPRDLAAHDDKAYMRI